MKIKTEHLVHVTSKKFGWNGTHGCCDLTDLGYRFLSDLARPIWPDACDQGFVVVSGRTGRELLFSYHSQETHDGEVVGWLFKSVDGSRSSGTFTISVCND